MTKLSAVDGSILWTAIFDFTLPMASNITPLYIDELDSLYVVNLRYNGQLDAAADELLVITKFDAFGNGVWESAPINEGDYVGRFAAQTDRSISMDGKGRIYLTQGFGLTMDPQESVLLTIHPHTFVIGANGEQLYTFQESNSKAW